MNNGFLMFLFDDIIEKLKGSGKMRTMLLSFNPYWYEKIKSGEKVFEYRTNFPDDIVKAYMYVSSPYKKSIGIIYLGRRIALTDWKEKYQNDIEVSARIERYMERRNYAMPILSYHHTEAVELAELRDQFPNFVSPQMYYFLDNRKELLYFLENKMCEKYKIEHKFDDISKNEICRENYN